MKKLIYFIAIATLLASCGPKKASNRAKRTAGRGIVDTNTINNTTNLQQNQNFQCSGSTSSIAQIIDISTQYSGQSGIYDFQTATRGFVAPSFDSFQYSNWQVYRIDMAVKIKFNSNGSIDQANTAVIVDIVDNLVGLNNVNGTQIQPYRISLTPQYTSISGQIDGQGNFTVQFADSLGKITLIGKKTAQGASGYIHYENAQAYNQVPQNAYLGGFQVGACAVQ